MNRYFGILLGFFPGFQKPFDSTCFMFQITHNLNWIVRKGSELESNIESVERIREYSEIATEVYKDVLFVGDISNGIRFRWFGL